MTAPSQDGPGGQMGSERSSGGVSVRRVEADPLYWEALKVKHPKRPEYPVGVQAVAGYYKTRYPDQDSGWKPVSIIEIRHEDEEGRLVADEKFEAFVAGARVPTARVWPYCGRYPITKQDYDQFMAQYLTADMSREPMEDSKPAPQLPIQLYWSAERAHIATALIAAQAAIPTIQKGHTATVEMKAGGTYEYEYADIADLMDGGVRKAVADAGLAIVHQPVIVPGRLTVYTTLIHGASGEWCMGEIAAQVTEAKPQTIGSLITYYKRYLLIGLLNIAIAEDDDDGAEGEDSKDKEITTGKRLREDEKAQEANQFANLLAGQIDKTNTVKFLTDMLADPKTAKRLERLKENYPEAYQIVERAKARRMEKLQPQAAE